MVGRRAIVCIVTQMAAVSDEQTYRRDATTWASFGALFAFGLLNTVLGPALPYLRESEDLSYLVGALHQAAFAIGGGIAGVIAARERAVDRTVVVAGGMV